MGQEGTGLSGLVLIGLSSARVEVVALIVAASLALGLLLVRAWYAHNQRHRRASHRGLYRGELARYSPQGFELGSDDPADPRGRPLAPTFVSPSPAGRAGGKRAGRRRVPTSPSAAMGGLQVRPQVAYGTYDPVTNLPRPFDAEEAERLRPPGQPPFGAFAGLAPPVSEAPPQDVPVLEEEPDPEAIPPPAGALPLLVTPPPPPAEQPAPPNAG